MVGRSLTWLALTVALVVPVQAIAQPAADKTHPLEAMWQRMMAELDAASASLEPKRTPPKPVKVRWATKRVAPLRLKAPVLAVTVADVDGDNKAAELIALTTRELVVLKLNVRRYRRGGRLFTRNTWRVAARFAMSGPKATIAPRDPVGALIVANIDKDEEPEILVRSSRYAKGVALEWKNGALVELSRFDGFPLCANVRAELSSGRNYYLRNRTVWPADMKRPSMPKRYYSARCIGNMVDSQGRKLDAFGRVATNGTFFVRFTKECGRKDEECKKQPTSELRLRGVGTAWTVADIDNDGEPEVVTSWIAAPGMKDRVTVYSGGKRAYRRSFVGGVVAVAAGDIDGDGDRDAVAVVRLLGATSVGVWTLNR